MQTAKRCVHEEVPEDFVVALADTVVHKGTVMVHLHDALFADFAMMSPRGLYLLALCAISKLHNLFNALGMTVPQQTLLIVCVVIHIHNFTNERLVSIPEYVF